MREEGSVVSLLSGRIIVVAIAALFMLIVGCGSYFTVDAGEVGVTFNKVTGKTSTYSSGVYLKLPIITSVTYFDVKTQKKEVHAESASKDLQKVNITVVLNYHLDYTKVNDLFIKVGEDFEEKVIIPAVNETIKATTAQFQVEDIIVSREKLKLEAEKLLKDKLIVYNIILEAINLTNIGFDPEFDKVVEAKQIEEQKIKTQQYIRLQAEENKKTTILNAQGEAESQRLLSQSVTRDTIELKRIEKWDGKYPEYYMVGGGSTSNLITLPAGK